MAAHMRTKRARRQAPPRPPRPVAAPVVVVPPGWTIEEDRREEYLALSCLVAIGKVA